MKPKLLILYTLIVMTPLGLLVWIGVGGIRDERDMVTLQINQVLTDELQGFEADIIKLRNQYAQDFIRTTDTLTLTCPALRAWLHKTALASQVFLLGADGKRRHPPVDKPRNAEEEQFLVRAEQVWQDKHRFFQPVDETAQAQTVGSSSRRPPSSSAHGWYSWFWGNGLRLLFWQRMPSGDILGIELNRSRFLADIIAALPDSPGPQNTASRSADSAALAAQKWIKLIDAKGDTIFQWGHAPPEKDVQPFTVLQLAEPLGAWRLESYINADAFYEALSQSRYTTLTAALVAAGAALLGLAIYFYRESTQALRQAGQRVTFVNQVSHELKTPLTNIRMYGDLLGPCIPDDDEKAQTYVKVIQQESGRLSRLIGNILSFARKQRNKLNCHRKPMVVDETIASVLSSFAPSLEAKGIQAATQLNAPATVMADPDILEQILGNLLSNIEKYCAARGQAVITSRQTETLTVITCSDNGPGIPPAQREKIFAPFYRVSDKLTDGVSGTGIGLAIARDLARLHGGDLRLCPTDEGACFEVTLQTPGSQSSRSAS